MYLMKARNSVSKKIQFYYHVELFEHHTPIIIEDVSVTEVKRQFGVERPLLGVSRLPGVTVAVVPGPQVVEVSPPLR